MATSLYCWRCKSVVPMLDEHEWAQLAPLLEDSLARIKRLRQERELTLAEAREAAGREALARYLELTGFAETNPEALWHHRRSLLGPPCGACGQPLRTPRAKHCAACGAAR